LDGHGHRLDVVTQGRRGSLCVAELREESPDGRSGTAVVVLSGELTSVASLLLFRTELVPVRPVAHRTTLSATLSATLLGAEQAAAAVRNYLDQLEAGYAEAAAACFATDAIYSFPPRTVEGARGIVNGRDAIEAVFRARGVNDARHHVEQVVATDEANGANSFVILGFVDGLGVGSVSMATFVSTVHLDTDGLISRYVAHMCVPHLPDFL